MENDNLVKSPPKGLAILAIVGPSGSGKTSLLNILSSRNRLSSGSSFDGQVLANQRELKRDDFSKFGAFVQ